MKTKFKTKSKMKKAILLLILIPTISGYLKAQTKTDTVYTFTEKQVTLLDQLLLLGDQGVGTSDNFSRNQWKEYHKAILSIDSIIKKQYFFYHKPQPQIKKEKPKDGN